MIDKITELYGPKEITTKGDHMSMFGSSNKRALIDDIRPLDISALEEEIKATMAPVDYAPRAPATAADIGRMTAEAVMASHKAAADSLDALGSEVLERMKLIDALTVEMNNAVKTCREAAERYREAGKLQALQIEQTSQLTSEVKRTAEEAKAKLAKE